ncbi:N-acetylglucosamine kinase [Phytohabitans suffuscus]|uniref:N-acetylglucosamine kinase n=1 Tax=Phytohabitans suffuscus TaxID=624315 RepID=UPI0022B2A1EF|nr:BadF/BadG/BcrA/BcrD ATPase family protein [Phytohabitans suffuscus]
MDAGGSRTVVRAEGCDGAARELVFPSMNPASVGPEGAAATLAAIFRRVVALAGGAPVTAWIGSASVTPETIDRVGDEVRAAASGTGLRGLVALSEDATTLLLAPPLNGTGIVTIVGTGTITVARGPAGPLTQFGGYEYLLDDEGSGFDLGLHGLRAAARAFDRRGPRTVLLERMREAYGRPVPALGVELAATPYPKKAVAEFAVRVCEAADEGDAVAAELVDHAVAAILRNIRAALPLFPGPEIDLVLAGSVATRSHSYAGRLAGRLARTDPRLRRHVVAQPAASALEMARRVRGTGAVPAPPDCLHACLRL